MRIGRWRVHGDWGHLAFIVVIALITAFYLADVVSVSMNTNNIILVLPLAILLLGLSLIVIFRCIRIEVADNEHDKSITRSQAAPQGSDKPGKKPSPDDLEPEQSTKDIIRATLLLLGVGVYVAAYEIIGLDAATLLFVLGSLLLLGVRGWLFVPLYAVIFTFVVVGGAKLLLSYPMPMMFF